MTTNKTTEQEKAKTVYDSMVRKFGATSPHTADARDKYIDTVTLELAHREALTAEAIRKANDAILAFNGWFPEAQQLNGKQA